MIAWKGWMITCVILLTLDILTVLRGSILGTLLESGLLAYSLFMLQKRFRE